MSFAHLHLHTQYSLLDGATRIPALVSRAKELGMNSVAITDHGAMYGVIEFYKEAVKAGIKPIIGCEVYTAPRSRFDKTYEYDSQLGHLVLLAKNNTGYENLMNIVSMASIEGFYYKPRVDFEVLEKNSEGIIALSACLAGDIPRAILNNDLKTAELLIEKYAKIFGDGNFYLEIQDHSIPEQKKVNAELILLSKKTGIPLVATNDVHYLNKSDAYYQDVLMCIQMQKTIDDTDRMKFSTEEFYFKSEDEMRELFLDAPEAIENTQRVADMCNIDIEFGKIHLPKFDLAQGIDPFLYLKEQCLLGLQKKCPDKFSEYMPRMEYELGVIADMGYIDYFLIVWDFVKYAKEHGIMVGPGRGSAAGSIVSYTLDITNVNPMDYNLIFERFLNPERITMPDIDIDFCYERRQEIIDYVTNKYGSDRVAQIITFGTMAAKAAIRDVGRALSISYAEVDAVAKQIPFELGITIEKAIKANPILKEMMENDKQVEQLITVSKALEGLPRHHSTHAAGVVITEKPVYKHVPLLKTDEGTVTEYTMTALEELGLLKMDFLGLRTLTIIRDAVLMIAEHTGETIDIDNIDFNDAPTYSMISNGDTSGVFQLESGGMRNFMRELKPRGLEDIIAGISLYRPGPMEQIPRYINNKNNPSNVKYDHPILENILNVTYGCMVYQEQVMEIVQEMAGYSLGRADLVRRAMSKKKFEVMNKERANFIHGIVAEDGTIEVDGAIRRGVSEKVANKIFDEMMDFANYAFNKSHAAAYAVIAYQTAYLKCHYPAYYMAALLCSTNDFVKYIVESQKMKIALLPPDINKSGRNFTVADGNIRFGLVAIKNVGTNVVESIIAERESGGDYLGYKDFCRRCGSSISKRVHEFMIKAGVFDSFNTNRAQLIAVYENIIDDMADNKKKNVAGQVSLFEVQSEEQEEEDVDFPNIPEYDLKTRLNMEKEILGFYVSGHPLSEHADRIKAISDITIGDITALYLDEELMYQKDGKVADGDDITICGVVSKRSDKISKNGNRFTIIEFEDMYGTIEVLLFSSVLNEYGRYLNSDGEVLVLKGKLDIDLDNKRASVKANEIFPIDMICVSNKLYLKIGKDMPSEVTEKIKKITAKHSGDSPVYIYFEDRRQLTCAPKSMWVDLSDRLLGELGELIGEENIKIK